MDLSLISFISNLFSSPTLLISTVLILGVVLVNGWTDAPNAIATCVSTRSLSPKKAIIMAAFFNYLGVFFMTLLSSTVAQTIYNMVDFGDNSQNALTGLCAGLFAIVTWAVLAWLFGIPTSESHALIAGISGAAIAIQKGISGINFSEWSKILIGLVFSTVLSFVLGYLVTKLIEKIFKYKNRLKVIPLFKKSQVISGMAMAFMHGAQDGQKFIGIFLMGVFLANGITGVTVFTIPVWLVFLISIIMTLGTSTKLEPYQGTAADLSSAICLFISSIFGMPVSTTHVKTTAIMGVGSSKGIHKVNWSVVKSMALAWILTFPGCGLLGYISTFVFMKIFN